jgi:hypothetical protein
MKTLRVSDQMWSLLSKYKYNKNFKSMDDTLRHLYITTTQGGGSDVPKDIASTTPVPRHNDPQTTTPSVP